MERRHDDGPIREDGGQGVQDGEGVIASHQAENDDGIGREEEDGFPVAVSVSLPASA